MNVQEGGNVVNGHCEPPHCRPVWASTRRGNLLGRLWAEVGQGTGAQTIDDTNVQVVVAKDLLPPQRCRMSILLPSMARTSRVVGPVSKARCPATSILGIAHRTSLRA